MEALPEQEVDLLSASPQQGSKRFHAVVRAGRGLRADLIATVRGTAHIELRISS